MHASPDARATSRSQPPSAPTRRAAAPFPRLVEHELACAEEFIERPREPEPIRTREPGRVLGAHHEHVVELRVHAELRLHRRHPFKHSGVVLGPQRLRVLSQLVGQVDQRDDKNDAAHEFTELGQAVEIHHTSGQGVEAPGSTRYRPSERQGRTGSDRPRREPAARGVGCRLSGQGVPSWQELTGESRGWISRPAVATGAARASSCRSRPRAFAMRPSAFTSPRGITARSRWTGCRSAGSSPGPRPSTRATARRSRS